MTQNVVMFWTMSRMFCNFSPLFFYLKLLVSMVSIIWKSNTRTFIHKLSLIQLVTCWLIIVFFVYSIWHQRNFLFHWWLYSNKLKCHKNIAAWHSSIWYTYFLLLVLDVLLKTNVDIYSIAHCTQLPPNILYTIYCCSSKDLASQYQGNTQNSTSYSWFILE